MLTNDPTAVVYWIASFVFPTLAAVLALKWMDERFGR